MRISQMPVNGRAREAALTSSNNDTSPLQNNGRKTNAHPRVALAALSSATRPITSQFSVTRPPEGIAVPSDGCWQTKYEQDPAVQDSKNLLAAVETKMIDGTHEYSGCFINGQRFDSPVEAALVEELDLRLQFLTDVYQKEDSSLAEQVYGLLKNETHHKNINKKDALDFPDTPKFKESGSSCIFGERKFIQAKNFGEQHESRFPEILLEKDVGVIIDLSPSSTLKKGILGAGKQMLQKGKFVSSTEYNIDVAISKGNCRPGPKIAQGDFELKKRGGSAADKKIGAYFHVSGASYWPYGSMTAECLDALADEVEKGGLGTARPLIILNSATNFADDMFVAFLATRRRLLMLNPGVTPTIAEICDGVCFTIAAARRDFGPNFMADGTGTGGRVAEALRQSFLRKTGLGELHFPSSKPTQVVHAEDLLGCGAVASAAKDSVTNSEPASPVHSSSSLSEEPPLHTATSPSLNNAQSGVKPAPARATFKTPAIASSQKSRVGKMWTWVKSRFSAKRPQQTAAPTKLDSNSARVECPERTAVHVDIVEGGSTRRVPLHANTITFSDQHSAGSAAPVAAPAVTVRTAIAGQSPQKFNLSERFLLHAIKSGNGLFQFVSTDAHREGLEGKEVRRESPLISQVLEQWKDSQRTDSPMILGGTHKITGVEELPIDGSNTDGRRLAVRVKTLGNPVEKKTVVLTHAGLRFQDRVLKKEEIKRADELIGSHLELVKEDSANPDSVRDPMVVSYSGVGRNATLICYREVKARMANIVSSDQLDAVLKKVIDKGREDRGLLFMHSDAQRAELLSALIELLPGKARSSR